MATQQEENINQIYPDSKTLRECAKLSISSVIKSEQEANKESNRVVDDKAIRFDYYLDSLRGKAVIGISNINKSEYILIRSYNDYSDKILAIKQCGDNFICETLRDFYICSSKINKQAVDFSKLEEKSREELEDEGRYLVYKTSSLANFNEKYLPSERTLQECSKISITTSKPLRFDYYLDSLRGKAIIGKSSEFQSSILHKNNKNYTSDIKSVKKCDNCYICETGSSLYICGSTIKIEEIDFNNLETDE